MRSPHQNQLVSLLSLFQRLPRFFSFLVSSSLAENSISHKKSLFSLSFSTNPHISTLRLSSTLLSLSLSLLFFLTPQVQAYEYLDLDTGWLINDENARFTGNFSVSGSLGVGTMTPGAKLDVNGSFNVGTLTNFTVSGGYLSYKPAGVACTNNQILSWDNTNSRWICSNYAPGVGGSGGDNYIPRFFGTGQLENSVMYDNGTNIGIRTITPTATLTVSGSLSVIGSNAAGTTNNFSISGGYLDYRPNNIACGNGQLLSWNNTNNRWQCSTYSQGVSGTGTINAMAKWALSGSSLILTGTTDIFETGGYVGIGTNNPQAQLHIDSGVAGTSGVRFTQLTAATQGLNVANAAVGVDANGNLIAIPPGNVAVYTGVNRNTFPTPNPNTVSQEVNYDFNRFFAIPGKATFVVTDGSGPAYNGPYFKEEGTAAYCSGTGSAAYVAGTPYNCATADPFTGLSASPNNSFTMTAKGNSYGYQLALGARGDAPLFARSGFYSGGIITNGLLTISDGTPSPWQKVITVPANHIEYLYINTGINSQLNPISGGGNIGIGTSIPDMRLVISSSGSAGSTDEIVRIQRGIPGPDASMVTTYGTPYLMVGGKETRTNSLQTIGFGYTNAQSAQPAEIGFLTTSTTGNTQGAIVFANRNGTTNTAPTEAMRIASNGNVGIGTNNPTAKLDVNGQIKISGGGVGSGRVLVSDAAGLATWMPASTLGVGGFAYNANSDYSSLNTIARGNDLTDMVFQLADNALDANFSAGSDRFIFQQDSAPITGGDANQRYPLVMMGRYAAFDPRYSVTLNSSTNVYGSGTMLSATAYMDYENRRLGIGTITPAYTLDVNGSFRVGTATNFTVNNGYLDYRPNNVACTNNQTLSWDNANSRWICSTVSVALAGTGTQNYVTKFNNAGGTTVGNSQIFDNGSNVGIGTATPGARLHVSGNSIIGGAAPTFIGLVPLNLINSTAGAIRTQLNLINTGGGGGAGSAIDFFTYDANGGTNPGMRIAGIDDANYSAHYTISTKTPGAANNPIVERLRVTADGNVGIGNNNPGARLDVSGNANITGSVTASAFVGNGAGLTNVTASSVPWSGVTGKPTTISGYGITDIATLFNNMGQPHNTQTDFNTPTEFGPRFVQGTANGPAIPSATQYYNMSLGLGSDYPYSQYAMQFAIPRAPLGGAPYASVRFREGGAWGAWSKIYAGYADTAGNATTATTATNSTQLGGVVAANYALLASPGLTGTPTAPTAAQGTNTTQIATTAFVKTEVDFGIAGLSWKNAVQVATTTNISLSGLQTIDGYTTISGDRVLVKNQSTASQNGIYTAAAGGWTRSTDTDTATEIDQSAVYIKRGTTQATTGWVLSVPGAITLGSTALTYSQFSGNGSYSAGQGITITGNSIAQTSVGTPGTYTKVTTDVTGRITSGASATTTDINEGTNLYFTDARARTAVTANAGTINYIPKFNTTGTIANSQIFDNGTNVGVGTASPGAKLDVNGAVAIRQTFRLRFPYTGESDTNDGTIGAGLFTSGLNIVGSRTDGTSRKVAIWGGITQQENSGGNSFLGNTTFAGTITSNNLLLQGDGTNAYIRPTNVGSNLYLGAANTNYLTILNNGYVGINMINPSYTLDVAGTIRAQATTGVGDALIIGNDSKLVDINLANTAGLYGITNSAIGSLQLGSGGGTISGSGGNIGIGDANPQSRLSVVSNFGPSAVPTTSIANGTHTLRIIPNSAGGAYNPLVQAGDMAITYTSGSVDGGGFVLGQWSSSAKGLRIDPAGNIGIGLTNPGAKLEVAGQVKITGGSPGTNKVLTSDATGLASWVTATSLFTESDPEVGANTTNYLSKWNGSALITSQIFDNATNVGVGTATPGAKLDVAGTLRFNSVDCINGVCPSNGAIRLTPNLHLNSGNGNAVIVNWDQGTTGNANTFRVGNGAGADSFTVNANGNTYIGGNVSIGSAVTSYPLNVNGDIAMEGAGVIYGGPNDVYMNQRVVQNLSTTNLDGMYINYNSYGGTAADLRLFASGTTERVRIKADTGNVGIGTTGPSQKLEVIGGIQSTRIDNAPQFILNGNNGNYKYMRFTTANSIRWDMGVDNSNEGGSNAGSNFYINRFADNGGFLDTPFNINRANGYGSFLRNLTVNSSNTTGGGLTLSDDGDFVDLNDGYGTFRFSLGLKVNSAGFGGTPSIYLQNNGNIIASTFNSLAINTTGTNSAANQIMRTDGSGYSKFGYINSNSPNNENPAISQVIVDTSDGFFRKASLAHFASSIAGSITKIASKGALAAETGRSVHDSGIYTFNTWNASLGDSTPTTYWSTLAWGNGAGGSAELAAEWTAGGSNLWFRSLRDTTDNWWTWKQIIHSGNIGSQSVNYANSAGAVTWANVTSKSLGDTARNDTNLDIGVSQYMRWKNYGNSHVIIDASQGTAPNGSAINNTNSQVAWSASYPTLMGWNGTNTYGVRVDSARLSDLAGSINGFNNPTTAATANTIVYRDASGHISGNYIFGSYLNASAGNSENPAIAQIWTQNGSDNYLRKSTPAHFKSQLGLVDTTTYGQDISTVKHFLSNKGAGAYVGANNDWSLQAYSTDGGAAGMSFHRAGVGAVNFGLDPDNVIRFGGWSAAANIWTLNLSGDNTIAGGFTAAGNITANGGSVYVGTTSSNLFMNDSDESSGGPKRIHANSNLIGFLNGGGGWIGYWDTNGNYVAPGNITVTNASRIALTDYGFDSIEQGAARTGDRYSYIDFHTDDTYLDYSLRLLKSPGANGYSYLQHRGTGNMELWTVDAAPMAFFTSSAERMRINANGNVGIGNSNPQHQLDVTSTSLANNVHVGYPGRNGGGYLFGLDRGGSDTSDGLYMSANSYFNGANWVTTKPTSSVIALTGDSINFFTLAAPVGTQALNYDQVGALRMSISSAGNVTIGTTTKYPDIKMYTESQANDNVFTAPKSFGENIKGIQVNHMKINSSSNWANNQYGTTYFGIAEILAGNTANYVGGITGVSGGFWHSGAGYAQYGIGVLGVGQLSGSGNAGDIKGIEARGIVTTASTSATVTNLYGIQSYIENLGTGGNITNAYAYAGSVNASNGRLPTNGYGLYLGQILATSNRYSIYATDGNAPSYFQAGIGIGTLPWSGWSLVISSNAYSYGSFISASDRNLKTNIIPVKDPLEKILTLTGYSFDWKKDGTHSMGVIAQEVQKVFPDIVTSNTSSGVTTLGVNYSALTAPLIESVKTLAQEDKKSDILDATQNQSITAMEKRLQELEYQNMELASQNQKLSQDIEEIKKLIKK